MRVCSRTFFLWLEGIEDFRGLEPCFLYGDVTTMKSDLGPGRERRAGEAQVLVCCQDRYVYKTSGEKGEFCSPCLFYKVRNRARGKKRIGPFIASGNAARYLKH